MTTLRRTTTFLALPPLFAALLLLSTPAAQAKDHSEPKAPKAPEHVVHEPDNPIGRIATTTVASSTPASNDTNRDSDKKIPPHATSTPPTSNSIEDMFKHLFAASVQSASTSTKPIATTTPKVATTTQRTTASSTPAAMTKPKAPSVLGGGSFDFRALETFFFPESVYQNTHFSRGMTFTLLALAFAFAGSGAFLLFGRSTGTARVVQRFMSDATTSRRRVPVLR